MQIFTKKQLWQRQQMQKSSLNHSPSKEIGTEDKDLKRGLEEICRLSTEDSRARKTRKSSSKVSFHPTAFVVLIPTSHEYHRAGLGQSLWWDEMDYREFKQSAMNEMKDFVQKYPEADCAQIFKMYYDTLMANEDKGTYKNPNNPLLSSPSCVVDIENRLRKVKQLPDEEGVQPQATKTVPVVKKLPSPLQFQRADSVQLYKEHYCEDKEPGIIVTGSSSDSLGPPSPVLGEEPLHTFSSSRPDSPTSSELLKHCDNLQVSPPTQNGMLPFLFNAAATMMFSLVQSD